MKTPRELVEEAKAQIREVDVDEAERMIDEGAPVVDVREPGEHAAGHLPGASHVPRGVLEFKLDESPALADKSAPVVVYCKSGGRSALAAKTLRDLGYPHAVSMAGGFLAWSAAGKATVTEG